MPSPKKLRAPIRYGFKDLTEPGQDSLTHSPCSSFSVLELGYLEGDYPFLKLPLELRQLCYEYVLKDNDDTAAYSTSITFREPHCIISKYGYSANLKKPKGAFALLFVNKQVSGEFHTALTNFSACRAYLEMMMPTHGGKLSGEMRCEKMNDVLGPEHTQSKMQARGLVIDITCLVTDGCRKSHQLGDKESNTEEGVHELQDQNTAGDFWAGETYCNIDERYINNGIITSPVFETLGDRLRSCNLTTDLCLFWETKPDHDTCLDVNPLSITRHQREAEEEAEEFGGELKPERHFVFEVLTNIIETMPNITRYSVEAGGRQSFASRKTIRVAWDHPDVVRSTDMSQGQWKKLYDDLKVNSFW